MQTALMGWVHQLGTLEYWEALLAGFEGLGPLVPILLAMVESFFPPLPLIAIVALNVAAHGGLLGFLYSWAGVPLGGIIMFLFWRRLIKRFFWKVASRSPKLEKAQQWVNRFDTSSLFMLSLLPFTPTSFMHFAFGMSDFDEKRYLRTVLLGKGLMVAMIAQYQALPTVVISFLFAVLKIGAQGMELIGIPSQIYLIIQTVIIFCMAAESGITRSLTAAHERRRAKRAAEERLKEELKHG